MPIVAFVAVILVSLGTGLPSANASSPSITCTGTETATYSPGVKLVPRTVNLKVVATFNPCISTNASIASGTAGTPPNGVPASLACLSLLSPASGEAVIHWNNGTLSRYSFTRSSQTVAGQLISTATGKVIAGEFLGRSVVSTVVSPSLNVLDCLSPSGLTHRTGTVALTII
ncbi:MAG TPA: hypothetical protein VMZ73_05365 [Acidimicrobiales bacterium]|nr:hypothetical protein [Acidimicrobiales bacterium]